MSDLPMEYGADMSKRGSPGRMLPAQREAHARLASLPTIRHTKETPIDAMALARMKGAEAAQRTRNARMSLPTPADAPQARKSRPNKWGFRIGEKLVVTDGKFKGTVGTYGGGANDVDVRLIVGSERRIIRATFLRRVAG